MELLLGAGSSRARKISIDGREGWSNLVTLDFNPDHDPDHVHDMTRFPYPCPSNTFDEIHAYDVMEHMGQQGDWRFFFRQWDELWRLLKPGGHFVGISPAASSGWAWGDPGHTRVITPECLVFLDRDNYAQVGVTPMTDYRFAFDSDWKVIHSKIEGHAHVYVLQARKEEVRK